MVCFEDGLVDVVVNEVEVRGQHARVRRPAKVALGHALGHDAFGDDKRRPTVAKQVRIDPLGNTGAHEVSLQELAQGRVLNVQRAVLVLVVDPQRVIGVVGKRVVVKPVRQVRRAGHDQRASRTGLAPQVQRVPVLDLGDVLELEVADLANPAHQDVKEQA